MDVWGSPIMGGYSFCAQAVSRWQAGYEGSAFVTGRVQAGYGRLQIPAAGYGILAQPMPRQNSAILRQMGAASSEPSPAFSIMTAIATCGDSAGA